VPGREAEFARGGLRRIALDRASFNVADDKPTFWDRVATGAWERGTFVALDQVLEAATTLLDLGAWVGPVTLYAAALGARVIAVEADPAALVQLRANIAANPDLAARIQVVDRAVAPQPGTVSLGARRKPGDSMSSALLAGAERSWDAVAITPAELAGMVGHPVRLVIKLDIEGGEYALLPRMGPLLARPGTALLLSLHPEILGESGAEDPAAATRAALAPLAGWEAFSIREGRVTPADPHQFGHEHGQEWLFLRPPERSGPAHDTPGR
jgi:FkbM family methyltransferase